ncbi:hypothetical protein HMI54_000888 [Coelomomyces lativittatus]|nr:hypothetical protein HMI56_000049 [Coelomomyces lativittatus]KAJ1511345.1 hypothetical protein HMI54_000888 [Coelomomyces lativittatus]KAJ1516294.1 hypothetical protein HMI55_002594 [Coelomomyces lativittatus]
MLALSERCNAFFLISASRNQEPGKSRIPVEFLSSLVCRITNKLKVSNKSLPKSLLETNLSLYIALPSSFRPYFFPIVYENLVIFSQNNPTGIGNEILHPGIWDAMLAFAFTSLSHYKLCIFCLKTFKLTQESFSGIFKKAIPCWILRIQESHAQSQYESLRLDLLLQIFEKRVEIYSEGYLDFHCLSNIFLFLQATLTKKVVPNSHNLSKGIELLLSALNFSIQNFKKETGMKIHFYFWVQFLLSIIVDTNKQSNVLLRNQVPLQKILDALAILLSVLTDCNEPFLHQILENVKVIFRDCVHFLGEPQDTIQDINLKSLPLILLAVKTSRFILHFSRGKTSRISLIDESFFSAHIFLFLHLYTCNSSLKNQWIIHHFDSSVQILHQLVEIFKSVSLYSDWILRLMLNNYEAFFQRLLISLFLPVHLSSLSNSSTPFIQILSTEEKYLPKNKKSRLKQESAIVLSYFLKSSRPVSHLLSINLLQILNSTFDIAETSFCLNMLFAYIRLWKVLLGLPLVRLELRNSFLKKFAGLICSFIKNRQFMENKITSNSLLNLLKNAIVDNSIYEYLSTNLVEKFIHYLLEENPMAENKASAQCLLNCLLIFLKKETCQQSLLKYTSMLIPWLYRFNAVSESESPFLSVWISHTPDPSTLLYHFFFQWLLEEEINTSHLSQLLSKIKSNHNWTLFFLHYPDALFLDTLSAFEKPLAFSILTLFWIPFPSFPIDLSPLSHSALEHEWINLSSVIHPNVKKSTCKHCLTSISQVFGAMLTQGWLESNASKLSLDFEYSETLDDMNVFGYQEKTIDEWWILQTLSLTEGFKRIYYLLLFLHRYLCTPLFLKVFHKLLHLLNPKSNEFQALYHYFKTKNSDYKKKTLFLTHFYQAIFDCSFFEFSRLWYIHHPGCFDAWIHRLALGYVWFHKMGVPEQNEIENSIKCYIVLNAEKREVYVSDK